jgi:pimeloyl-ACP methyl ester carboxylesterase
MASVNANGIRIEYEEFGNSDDPVILLIIGFAAQMTVWPESFCQALAGHSFRVIRFDNRDVGLSSHLDGVRVPGMVRSMAANLLGIRLKTPYTLDDMALDAAGLLDALGIEQAHIVGASMGGMIAQIMAAKHARYVKSLASLMSTSGNRKLRGPRPDVLRHILFKRKQNMDHDAMIEYLVGLWQLIGSPEYPTALEETRHRVTSWVDRNHDPAGSVRQFAAMAADGDRTPLLGTIQCSTLVIHGEEDPLIRADGGRHTAECIRNAKLHVISGMGHHLPEVLIPSIAELIARHCAEAQNNAQRESHEAAVVA